MRVGPFTMAQYLAQYRWLRDQYALRHLVVDMPGVALTSPNGEVVGYLEEIRLIQNRLKLRGWAKVASLSFQLGPAVRQLRPHIGRNDVAAAVGGDPHVGFATSLPYCEGDLQLVLTPTDAPPFSLVHPLRVARARRRATVKTRLRFWRDMLPLVPSTVSGLRRADPDLRRRLKTKLRLDRAHAAVTLDPRFLAADHSADGADSADGAADVPDHVTIILPVFNAFDLLPEVLSRVLENTDLPWHLVVIEDCSTDPALRPWLRDWVAAQDAGQSVGQVTLLENDRNLGFIRSVNLGFDTVRQMQQQTGRQGPVILLNSDAMVPPQWASRLTAPLAAPAVATVTPLSNDAEIFSAPVICRHRPLATGQGDRIDAVLRDRIAARCPVTVTAPTGVGFCMAIGPDWLARVGAFDTAFGRGYGEEVDWCRRAAALGGQHSAAPDLFVEHRGGASFGAEKLALVQQNNAVITTRYPGYDRQVQEFIRDDPLATPRMVAALAWVDTHPDIATVPVYIAHAMGGGADHYLRDRIKQDAVALVLRFGGAERCQLELETGGDRFVVASDDLDLIARLVTGLGKRRIIYSCAVGDPDLMELPDVLLTLAQGDVPLEVLFHDYLPLSPSYTLLDKDGVFRGVPQPDSDDPAHIHTGSNGQPVPLAAWRAAWGRVLQQADSLTVFSQASARIVAEVYPQVADRIELRPHQIMHPIAPVVRPDGGRRVIGVLGAIGPQKGAALVSALSAALERRSDLDLVLIGYIAPGYPLKCGTVMHGPYDAQDVVALAQHYGVTHWLVPSIWPETFSYTVHECLATGLPTMAFAIGAQGDAVRAATNGRVIAWRADQADANQMAEAVIALVD